MSVHCLWYQVPHRSQATQSSPLLVPQVGQVLSLTLCSALDTFWNFFSSIWLICSHHCCLSRVTFLLQASLIWPGCHCSVTAWDLPFLTLHFCTHVYFNGGWGGKLDYEFNYDTLVDSYQLWYRYLNNVNIFWTKLICNFVQFFEVHILNLNIFISQLSLTFILILCVRSAHNWWLWYGEIQNLCIKGPQTSKLALSKY